MVELDFTDRGLKVSGYLGIYQDELSKYRQYCILPLILIRPLTRWPLLSLLCLEDLTLTLAEGWQRSCCRSRIGYIAQ